ncbi:DNA methyltransferase [Candidatus Parabeggiatoa sp. HSG14]|uniref:DNA methyltransferase n=1 Tax=Candidatus Parabeggiatoa sp. HSG14 TaxID=3055593 RepID=UPI0025A82AB2|nr:type I restriction enzyme HsdR N-terminal domain-containing protein [Thiotrichales bacterium HSG14]
MTEFILENFDFSQLNSPDFKEDSVREVLILPILQQLGYDNQHIVRSKSLEHPFIKIGSKKRKIKLIPDYLLKVADNYAWVLDAKAPTEEIKTGEHIEQVYSYAIHPEVRTKYFALCNGYEFVLFRQDTEKPVLSFHLAEVQYHWETLQNYLAPSAFQSGKHFVYETAHHAKSFQVKETDFDYLDRPLLDELPVRKRAAKRHFGVHGYFTKQTWNVVQEYIRHFSRPDDLVLDPYGGSGVTAIEAMMTDRRAIHLDLNPMSFFLVDSLATPVDLEKLGQAFEQLKNQFEKKCPSTDEEIARALEKYPYPTGLVLPKNSDVETIEQLFSSKQKAQLAFLKHLILKQKDASIRKSLLLMFSNLLTKTNLTYHTSKVATKDGQGDASAFRYYRYRIAPKYVDIDVLKYFELRFKKVVAAKREMQSKINAQTIDRLQVIKGTATDLSFLKNGSVDYIYTDPPYGKKIPYLDLSTMWNGWLDLPVTAEDYAQEAIEGGEHDKTKTEYNTLIAKSIEEMYRVLKFDRWMSFVFAHKDPEFWHLIIDTAERCGFEYAGAVKQSNGQTSFKKRQNPFTVLSGQLIINFKKVRHPKAILKANLGMNIGEIIMQTIEGVIAKHNGATLEQINDELIIKGLELGFLDLLKKEYSDLTPILMQTFDYDEESEKFRIHKNTKFKTSIDERLRIKYYLISFLRRAALEKKHLTFDEIVLHIMPLLKNGTTPENQIILNVLEDTAIRLGENQWKLRDEGQGELNF